MVVRLLFILLIFSLPGCDLLKISQSGKGIRDGNDAVSQGEFQKAVQYYEGAMDGTMLTAEAHYRLGLLYEDKLKNDIAALHHFERYLELAPQGQFAGDVKGYVERLRLVVVSRMAEGAVVPAKEVTRLKNENLELREQLGALRNQPTAKAKGTPPRGAAAPKAAALASPAVSRGTPPPLPAGAAPTPEPEVRRALPVAASAAMFTTAPPAPAPAQPAAAAAPPQASPAPVAEPRSHTVASGETLSRISRKYYGKSSEWQKIAEANKEILPDPTKLKPGMVLVIPPK